MKRLISSFLIILTLITASAPLIASAQSATSCSSITNLTQYANCCGSGSNSLACTNFALQSGGAGSTTANSCTNVSTLAQYSSCCSGSSTDTLACKTFAASEQSNASVVQQFNPNVNITSGNTYGGSSGSSVSISGIGGAIASCLNVGSFLTSSETSSVLSGVALTEITKSPSAFIGATTPVATSDSKAQAALADQNKTTDCLDGIAYAVAKNALAQITNKTINWVNTGLNGNPLYVQNQTSYMNSIKNQQEQLFLGVVQESDPIFGNALRSSITLDLTGRSDGLLNTSLNNPQSQAYNSFQSDFTNGGWNALLNPSYNSVGAFFKAVDDLSSNIDTQQQAAQTEANQGNGYLNMKYCSQYANNGAVSSVSTSNQCATIGSDTTYEACCTGQSTDDSVACQNYATADAAAAGTPACANITDDTIYDQCCGDASAGGDSPMCIAYNTSSSADANTPTNVTQTVTNTSTNNGAGLVNNPVCSQYTTTTPGSLIASQVQSVTNSPVQQLTYADKINEVLGGFFDSFVNNLLSKGLHGSGTLSLVGNPEDANYVENTTSPGDASGLGYQSTGSGDDADTGDFDISRPQELRAILQTQEDFLNRTLDAQVALERIVPAVGALDYCIPGPNPDYQTGLSSNWQTFLSSIQQAPANSPTTLQTIVGALPIVGGLFDAFMDNSKPPPIWTANAVLSDKATGGNLALDRTFYAPSGHSDGTTTTSLEAGLQTAYAALVSQLSYYNPKSNTFQGTPVGNAFEQAAASDADPKYVDGFLSDAYTDTDSIVGYNQAATTIDQQYDQNISATTNAIEQMQDILSQVDQIVSTAKARYISQNPSVNVQCLDNAYVVDTSAIVPVARVEPSTTDPLVPEEDGMIQHSIEAGNNFYSNEAI
jgi:hypothetical protein